MTAATSSSPIAGARALVLAHPVATRWILAGPIAVLVAVATMMALPLWLPEGPAGIDNIAYPILLSPILWAIPFLYACLAEDLFRCAAVLLAALVLQGGVVALALAA